LPNPRQLLPTFVRDDCCDQRVVSRVLDVISQYFARGRYGSGARFFEPGNSTPPSSFLKPLVVWKLM
jgi:hypothetical protein